MENKNIYAKGLFFNKLKPDTPDSIKKWKKGGVSIQVENFVAQLKELTEYVSEKGYLNFDLVENEKDGEKFLSFKLNTWKPEKTEVAKDNINPEDVPW